MTNIFLLIAQFPRSSKLRI